MYNKSEMKSVLKNNTIDNLKNIVVSLENVYWNNRVSSKKYKGRLILENIHEIRIFIKGDKKNG